MADSSMPSRSVFRPVPTPLNQVRGANVQGEANRQARPGKGKTGRVNASELSKRLRNLPATEKTIETVVWAYKRISACLRDVKRTRRISAYRRTPLPRSKDSTHPSRISLARNVATPMESDAGRCVGKPTARTAEFSSGRRTIQEAKASSRKATGIHNRLDRVIPNPKGC
jgi:hypothetical protein